MLKNCGNKGHSSSERKTLFLWNLSTSAYVRDDVFVCVCVWRRDRSGLAALQHRRTAVAEELAAFSKYLESTI